MDNKPFPLNISLTQREYEVLALIADGFSTNEIAEQLVLSSHTVAWYVKQILRKLDVNRRTQAVAKARTLGLLDGRDEESNSPKTNGWSKSRSNLPLQPTPFVGRQDEIAQIALMLDDKDCRLLTLVGPGGIGKTRLALRVAASTLERSTRRVCFIALQSLTSQEDIVPTIANALGIQFQTSEENLLEQLSNYLRDKSVLLVMDNFEHLLDGTYIVSRLLSAASGVQILATSRESLNLREERLFSVEGLRYPIDADDISTDEFSAVSLFAQRASRLDPDFPLDETLPDIIQICQLVSGIPLALELAASWVKTLSCRQIAAEIKRGLDILVSPLRNMPERHRSMRVVFDYSWQMLSTEERVTFERLSVFRGGCTFDAVRYVANTDFHVLQMLVDKSFISFDQTSQRYNIHELLRQYGELHLNRSSNGITAVHDLHAAYFVGFLEQRRQNGFGRTQKQFIQDLRADLENVRIAWRRSVDHAKVEDIQRSAQTLYVFFTFQSRFQEAADEFVPAIRGLEGRETEESAGVVLAELLNYCAWAYIRLGDHEQATAMLERSRTLYQNFQTSPPPGWTTEPLVGLSLLAGIQGDYIKAEELGWEACRISEIRADRWELQTALYVTTSACFHQGKYAEAQRCAERALTISEETGDQYLKAILLNDLGRIARVLGDYGQAKQRYRASFTIRQAFDDPQGMAAALSFLGEIALLEEDYAEADKLFHASYTLYTDIGDRGGMGYTLCGLGTVALERGSYQQARHHFYDALRIAYEIEYAPFAFSVLTGVSQLLLHDDQPARALELLSLIVHHPRSDQEAKDHAQHLLTGVQHTLADNAHRTAWKYSKSMNMKTMLWDLLNVLDSAD